MTVAGAALCLALAAAVASAQGLPVPSEQEFTGNPTEGKPAIRYERVAGEIVGGTYAGVLGYFAGRGLGTAATSMMNAEQDRLREQIVNGVGIVGASFAIGSAVYAIGNIGAETGSFPQTMGGVSIGVAASLLMSKVVFQGRMPSHAGTSKRRWWMATLDASLPAIAGTIAFNKSRRWQR
ncbi:MAG: hypothetical protein FJ363_12110 [Gemmatimonadetes bacterium]|nr:hypothetical protein [Gemmatimonadota bacterium]